MQVKTAAWLLLGAALGLPAQGWCMQVTDDLTQPNGIIGTADGTEAAAADAAASKSRTEKNSPGRMPLRTNRTPCGSAE